MSDALVTIEGANLIATEFEQAPGRVQTAMVRAANRAIVAGRTAMARLIAEDMGLPVGRVTKALRQRLATRDNPDASVGAGFARLPLVDFSARGPLPSRGKGRGVSYRIGKGSKRGRLDTAFMAVTGAHTGVFKRAGRARLPIVQLYGPSIGKVFATHRPVGLARAAEMFDSTFDRELERARGK